jgi:hypothetical protein
MVARWIDQYSKALASEARRFRSMAALNAVVDRDRSTAVA